MTLTHLQSLNLSNYMLIRTRSQLNVFEVSKMLCVQLWYVFLCAVQRFHVKHAAVYLEV